MRLLRCTKKFLKRKDRKEKEFANKCQIAVKKIFSPQGIFIFWRTKKKGGMDLETLDSLDR